MGVGGDVGGVVLTSEPASEHRGHVFGHERSDGDQAGTDHGCVVFKERPDNYVGTGLWSVVSVGSKRGVGICTCCIKGADLVGDYVF
jgi:hypothetical protein